MNRRRLQVNLAAVLLLLVGGALGIGAWQLLSAAESWPDIVANPAVTRRTAAAMLLLSLGCLISVYGVTTQQRWGRQLTFTVLGLFTLGGFAGNYFLFGDIRWLHSGTNLIIAALIVSLLTSAGRVPGN